MKRARAANVVSLLGGIEREFARFHAGADADEVMAKLEVVVGELRDALWHEVPYELALLMDEEEGLPADRGRTACPR